MSPFSYYLKNRFNAVIMPLKGAAHRNGVTLTVSVINELKESTRKATSLSHSLLHRLKCTLTGTLCFFCVLWPNTDWVNRVQVVKFG